MVRRKLVVVLIVCWTMAVSYGLHALMLYKGKPGSVGGTPEIWPRNELLNPSPDKPQLVMFAHPMWPCTRASLGELELLAAQAKGKFDAAILFYQPEGKGEAWSKTASIDMARSIPGVRVILDADSLTDAPTARQPKPGKPQPHRSTPPATQRPARSKYESHLCSLDAAPMGGRGFNGHHYFSQNLDWDDQFGSRPCLGRGVSRSHHYLCSGGPGSGVPHTSSDAPRHRCRTDADVGIAHPYYRRAS